MRFVRGDGGVMVVGGAGGNFGFGIWHGDWCYYTTSSFYFCTGSGLESFASIMN